MNGVVEIFVGLLLAVAVLALLARKLHIPYPILFVIGGLLLGSIRGLPPVRLNPELVFPFFLPPLLFPAALFTSWRDFRLNLRPISLLAIGLVLFTTVIVAYLAQYFLHLPLAAGFVLGAIISPPDAIAATAIAERLKVPRRIVTILEGESLVNDATALVAYRFAIAAVLSGSFSLAHATGQFFFVGIGGILIGLAVGWLAQQFHKRVDDAPIEITVSLLTPFAAYLSAERLGVSGVLSVVHDIPIHRLVWFALVISVAVIAIRILWVFPAAYLPRLLFKSIRDRDPYPSWRHVTLIGWTGMRGVVSLAAALALKETFPGRDLILFLTFTVILVTLVVQGLSLPLVIRWLGVKDDGSMEIEEREARLKANQAALARLNEIGEHEPAKADALQRLRAEYEDHIRQVEGAEFKNAGTPMRLFSSEFERLSHEALQVERRTILKLRNEDAIADEVLRRIQRDIDLAEARLQHHQ
jgi:CPA1 family monovalent cation:H+ antiporter